MKNQDIVTLAAGGFLSASAHCLPPEHFYKWHRFRRAVNAAWQNIVQQEKELLAECGIPDGKTDSPETIAKFNEVRNRIMEEIAEVPATERIPFQFYKAIYDENHSDQADVFASIEVETLVLDNLFEEPQ